MKSQSAKAPRPETNVALDTPGAWFRAYRLRCRPDGYALSPERLGQEMNVHGMTIRRWEAGEGQPSERDLKCFAHACELHPLELEFLQSSFKAQETEDPPDREAFEVAANAVLWSEFPASLIDTFFVVRARNSYMQDFFPKPRWRLKNPFQDMLTELLADPDPAAEARVKRWFRRFWLATSHLCGSPAYWRFLETCWSIGGFPERWLALAADIEADFAPVGTPHYYERPDVGRFRVLISRIVVPPVYYLVEYFPVDDKGAAWLAGQRSMGPASVGLHSRWHWPLDPELGSLTVDRSTMSKDGLEASITESG
jgi:transcriptional regulator with XRE-family HTH domain